MVVSERARQAISMNIYLGGLGGLCLLSFGTICVLRHWSEFCFVSEPNPIKASLKIMSCSHFLEKRKKKRLMSASDMEGKIGTHMSSDLSPLASEGFLRQAQADLAW